MKQEHPLRRVASSPLQGDHASGPAQPVPRHVLDGRVLALEDFYRLVQAERMQGIPLLNLDLRVEAVDFVWGTPPAEDGGELVAEGVLITPWFMSLLRLPARVQPHGNRVGRSAVRDFGSERFDFIGAHDPAIGYHETCALFSPMGGFTTQALARETARAALALTRPAPVAAAEPVPARRAFFLGRSTAGVRP
jgi:[NiFe] hydrogenase assembly HybE family chaperone